MWRRRKCQSCQAIVTTTEHIDYEKSWVVQTDGGVLKPFLRDKLFISLYKSLGHRPTATTDTVGLTATVMAGLQQKVAGGVVTPAVIADSALITLQRFDTAAASSYSAYH